MIFKISTPVKIVITLKINCYRNGPSELRLPVSMPIGCYTHTCTHAYTDTQTHTQTLSLAIWLAFANGTLANIMWQRPEKCLSIWNSTTMWKCPDSFLEDARTCMRSVQPSQLPQTSQPKPKCKCEPSHHHVEQKSFVPSSTQPILPTYRIMNKWMDVVCSHYVLCYVDTQTSDLRVPPYVSLHSKWQINVH